MKNARTGLRRALALLLTLLLLGVMSGAALAADSVTVTGQYAQTDARAMLKGINDFRTSEAEAWYWNESNSKKIKCSDLQKLTYDYTLERIAMLRAAEITQLFSHTRPDGTKCFTAYEGTNYKYMGENLAMGTLDRDGALEALKETYEDYKGQGHRRNMLDSGYTAVGVAHFCYNGLDYWVQEFGAPALDTKKTTANDAETSVKVSLVPDPSGSSVGAAKINLTLSWPRDKNADGYQLQYATNKKFKKKKSVKIKKNKTTKYTIKNQKTGRKYYVRVRSYKKSGKKTKYSKWSNTVVFNT